MREAVILLSKNVPQIRVAELIGVDRKTIARWLKQPDFRKELFDNRRGHLESVLDKVVESTVAPSKVSAEISEHEEISESPPRSPMDSLIGKSIAALDAILSCPESRNADRIRASELVLKLVGSDRIIQTFQDQKSLTNPATSSSEERASLIDRLLKRRAILLERKLQLQSELQVARQTGDKEQRLGER